jgi:hypothetical protein
MNIPKKQDNIVEYLLYMWLMEDASLADNLGSKDIQEKGYLQFGKDILAELTDLHARLLKDAAETAYIEAYYKTLPHIVALRAKSGQKDISEIETCVTALYGYLLLKLQEKEISQDTQLAISEITKILALLSNKYKSFLNADDADNADLRR